MQTTKADLFMASVFVVAFLVCTGIGLQLVWSGSPAGWLAVVILPAVLFLVALPFLKTPSGHNPQSFLSRGAHRLRLPSRRKHS